MLKFLETVISAAPGNVTSGCLYGSIFGARPRKFDCLRLGLSFQILWIGSPAKEAISRSQATVTISSPKNSTPRQVKNAGSWNMRRGSHHSQKADTLAGNAQGFQSLEEAKEAGEKDAKAIEDAL